MESGIPETRLSEDERLIGTTSIAEMLEDCSNSGSGSGMDLLYSIQFLNKSSCAELFIQDFL